jgi:ABC-type arginine transport system ATPase subunit
MQLDQEQVSDVEVESSGFNILFELDGWAAQMDPWQRCALSMLVSQQIISEDDRATIFQEFLWDKGLVPSPTERTNYVLNAPTATQKLDAAAIRLKSIKNVVGVNALSPDQQLDIGPQLTVVYGPNGSGKSGYARILKASCFTRSKQLAILGNINIPVKDRLVASATFDLHDGGEEVFKAGKPSKLLRDNLAVFDSSCIRVHTDDKKAFIVTPYLFDVFPRMVSVIADVNERLKALRDSKAINTDMLCIPEGKSEVATLLKDLSYKTDRERLKLLGTFTLEDDVRITQLDAEITQLKKSDPTEIIKKKSSALNDLIQLESKLQLCINSLSVQATNPIAAMVTELRNNRQQATAISAATFNQEPLQPVGTQIWKSLLTAAIAYNEEVYPGHQYPSESEDARCVLCQQPLLPDGKERLNRFYEFIKSDLENKINASEKQLNTLAKPIANIDLTFFGTDSVLRRTADDLDANLTQHVTDLISLLAERKETVLHAIKVEADFQIKDATTPSFKHIKTHKDKLTAEIQDLKTKNIAQLTKQYSDEQALLNERKILSARLDTVFAALDNLIWLNQAAMIGQVSQRFVTDRQKALMIKLVGAGFKEGFLKNCEQLGLTVPLDFKIRGTDGETNRQLEFGTAGGEDAQPSEVLSEGEQTVVALADFLTEIALNEKPVGVIFDDPVSSMDHTRKESIAKRLVQEAQNRQVIVFTHDILFSHHLANEAEKIGAGFNFFGRTVARNHDGAIGCIDQIIFPHSHYEGEAVTRAKHFLEKAKTVTATNQKDLLEKGCGCLRTAYEDFIQKRLFADVVRRWRENIRFTLKDVYIDEAVVSKIDEHMAILSRYIDAHSHSDEYHENPLTTNLLESEIQAHENLMKEYKAAKKIWENNKGKTVFA